MAQEYTIEPADAKVALVGELTALVGQTKAAILTDYRGLSVAELTELRKKLRDVNAEYRVVKTPCSSWLPAIPCRLTRWAIC